MRRWRERTWRIFRCALAGMTALAAAACGTPDGGAGGSLAVSIRGVEGFNPSIAAGKIALYRVRIEGPGIAAPIEASFPADAAGGVIDGVPVGGGREVSVTAENINDVAIRAGEASGVEVGDGPNEVDVVLQAVPIFTNLADGAAVDNTRLVFRVLADPAHPTIVENRTAGADAAGAASGFSAGVSLDAATGLGMFTPSLMPPGERIFAVRDAVTGRESIVRVMLLDGAKRRAAPLMAAAGAVPAMTVRVAPFGKETVR